MTNSTKKVEIGNIYNIGIGNGDSVDCEVVRIEEDSTNGDQAVLEMIEYGGPLQKVSVAYLMDQKVSDSQESEKEQARRSFLEDCKNEEKAEETKNDSKENTAKVTDFRTSTIGLFMDHENIKKPQMISIDIHNTETGNIALLPVSANNLNRIKSIPAVFVSVEEYEDCPYDAYDNTVFAMWAFNKCGLS